MFGSGLLSPYYLSLSEYLIILITRIAFLFFLMLWWRFFTVQRKYRTFLFSLHIMLQRRKVRGFMARHNPVTGPEQINRLQGRGRSYSAPGRELQCVRCISAQWQFFQRVLNCRAAVQSSINGIFSTHVIFRFNLFYKSVDTKDCG